MLTNATLPRPPIVYPESDGEPMSDNTKQFRWIVVLFGNIAALFRDRADVFVSGNQFWFPREGEPDLRVAPAADERASADLQLEISVVTRVELVSGSDRCVALGGSPVGAAGTPERNGALGVAQPRWRHLVTLDFGLRLRVQRASGAEERGEDHHHCQRPSHHDDIPPGVSR